ncbi:hypothetical protein PHYSODRAFT_254961 [Phytophthora sojae]|uniref:Uncharacterized protein n=1 Tax=Phytophthora sojae (strain P6497) TaxID=1094619 RepID=G4YV00_PHYSP|nr:hypothetical protein PHYSODRAFT_254961 [Phytophthora sojae]EGZ23670.1 hypothetical protein PHYSODRAFT_254961 [Phytophthora sojae]|eukprot:XP_009518958.1 hypothetical protein PHYSODRAFT_254961 [Phytophthora sojae]
MAPARGDAPEARTQGDDAQERASQSGDASKASKSLETPAEASPSGDERRVHFAGNDDDKEGDNGEGHVDADGDEVMEGSTVDTEAKESNDRLNADPNGPSRLNAVPAILNAVPTTLNAGDEASDAHSLLAPGWRERRIVSNAEYAGFSASKLVLASSFSFVDDGVQRWLESQRLRTQFSTARFQDGYGGLEVLQVLETLTDEDYKDLESVVGPNVRSGMLDVRQNLPSGMNLASMLKSLVLQREFASVLSVFRAERLAERTFNTVSFLKRLLTKYRQLKLALESGGQTSALRTLDLLDVKEGLRREWAAMEVYWKEKVERITAAKQDGESAFKENFIRQQEDHQHALNARADEIAELKDQLQTSEALCEVLRREIREKTLGASRLQATGNVSKSSSVILRTPQCVCGDYAAERKKATGGDSAPKLVPPLTKTVDLTGGDAGSGESKSKQSASKGKCASKGSRKKMSWNEFLKKLQLRPSNYRPSPQLALPASSKLARSEDEARAALPGPQVWRKLRHDLRYVMRNGFAYEDAKELVSGEHVVHPLIHHEPLVKMLVSIIRSDGLDAVPWTSFVPEMYYLSAEVRLESMFDRDEKPEPWFSLDEEYVQDGLEPLSSSSSGDSEYEQEDEVEPDNSDAAPKVSETVVPAKQSSPAAKRKLDMLESGAANQKEGSTLRRSPRNQSKAKPNQSGSAVKKARLAAKVIEQLTESPRKATALVRIPFKRLTLEQLSVIETPDTATTTSYRCSGIKMCFYQKKSKPQTIGFPNNAPQKSDMKFLEERWSMEQYVTLFPVNSRGKMIKKKLPWNVMFAERTKVLYYHDAATLSADIMRGLKKHVEFMEKFCQAWWDLLHWITINLERDAASQRLYKLRRRRTDSLIRRYKTHLKKLRKIKGFPETLFQEPGVWPLPQRICNWIWEDPRVVDSSGEPKSLRQQLVELDEREPARTLWATVANEVERTKYVSADLRANRSIPLPRRARNWIVPDRADNEPADEDDEDDDELSEVDDEDEG